MNSLSLNALVGRVYHRWAVLYFAGALLLACSGGEEPRPEAGVPTGTADSRWSTETSNADRSDVSPVPSDMSPTRETYRGIRKAVAACVDSSNRSGNLRTFQAQMGDRDDDSWAQYGSGLIHLAMGNDTLALEHLERMAAADPRDPFTYYALAEAARRVGRLRDVVGTIRHRRKAGSTSPYATLGTGILCAELHLWAEADSLAEAVMRVPDLRGEALLLRARACRTTGKHLEALHCAVKAESLATGAHDPELRARSRDAMSIAKRLGGDFKGALNDAETAFRIASAEGFRYLEPALLAEMGFLRLTLGDLQGAVDILQEAHVAATELGEKRTEAWVIKFLGDLAYEAGACEEALQLHRTAGERLGSLSDTAGRAAALTGIANDLSCLGDLDAALAVYDSSLELQRKMENPSAEATVLGNMAHTFLDRGDLGQAVIFFDDAIAISEECGDGSSVAEWSLGRGDAYRGFGDSRRARTDYENAYEAAVRLGARSLTGRVLGSLGALDVHEGNYQAAVSRFRDALALFEELDDTNMVGALHQNLATIMIVVGRCEDAVEYLESALRIARGSGSLLLESHVLVTMGEGAYRDDRLDDAAAYFRRAGELVHDLPGSGVNWMAAYGLARCRAAEGDYRGSIASYVQALKGLETGQESVPVETWAYGFLSSHVDIYADYIQLLAGLHREDDEAGWDARALQVAQRAKARVFRKTVAEVRFRRRTGSANLRDPERELLVRKLSRTSKSLWEATPGRKERDGLLGRFDDIEGKLAHLDLVGRTRDPLVAEPVNVNLASLQNSLEESGIELLLEYFLGVPESYLWIVTPSDVSMRFLPEEDEIGESVRLYLGEAGRPPRIGTDIEHLAQSLAHVVLGPERLPVQRGSRVAIVPDGCLFYVPFEALPIREADDGSTFLVDEASVFYLPSSADSVVLDEVPRESREGTVLAVGVTNPCSIGCPARLPPLRYAEEEAKRVCAVFSSDSCAVITGPDATEERLLERLKTPCHTLHLATHSLIDQLEPRRSCILLAPDPAADEDGILLMDEIAAVERAPDLVVLSCCQTGIGELIRGEGMVSLSRAFLCAGSRTVVVSLWPVNDRSTLEWMTTFYEYLAAGSRRDEAVRAAKLSFLNARVSSLHHPYYWAPFIVIGQV